MPLYVLGALMYFVINYTPVFGKPSAGGALRLHPGVTGARISVCETGRVHPRALKSFGANRVLEGIDLDVRKGEVVVVIGPSGSRRSHAPPLHQPVGDIR